MPLEEAIALRQERLDALKPILETTIANRSDVVLEIGSGHGHFLTAFATAHPNTYCIGIDLLSDRLQRSQRKSDRAKLTNIAWYHAEAGVFLDALPASVRITRCFVLFPDPWPKRRHAKNRLIQPRFLSALAARATADTWLHFRTDAATYFSEALVTVDRHPDWKLDLSAPWPFELETVFQARADAYQSLNARCAKLFSSGPSQ